MFLRRGILYSRTILRVDISFTTSFVSVLIYCLNSFWQLIFSFTNRRTICQYTLSFISCSVRKCLSDLCYVW